MKATKPKTPNELFQAAVARGLRRSAKTARKISKMHGLPIYVSKKGKVVALWP